MPENADQIRLLFLTQPRQPDTTRQHPKPDNPTTQQPDSPDSTRKRVHIPSAPKARDESSAPKARHNEGIQRRRRGLWGQLFCT